ncbi:MAG: Type 1 glutamine amidotransferase-like domain-containing protein [Parcubacteria group bacterium]|nr:Type 1 glutamine amidotransferase-like domain-containing protein [Parcubacteria group bacterium]
MRVTGIDIFIKKVIGQEESLYCGVSAGSIIAGPSIEIAGWGSEGDTNEINLEDLTGFHFTDIAVSPHFKSYLQQEVENFKNKVTYPIIALTDGEALFVQDTHYTIIK